MLPSEQAEMIRALEQARIIVARLPVATPCEACRHFDDGHCLLADCRVPDQVLPEGCESFEESVIPF